MKKTVIGFVKSPILAPCKESKSGIQAIFVLLMESGILEIIWDPGLGFGIRNIAQGIRNATNDWNPAIHGVESKIQECLDLYFLTWGDKTMLSPQMPGR